MAKARAFASPGICVKPASSTTESEGTIQNPHQDDSRKSQQISNPREKEKERDFCSRTECHMICLFPPPGLYILSDLHLTPKRTSAPPTRDISMHRSDQKTEPTVVGRRWICCFACLPRCERNLDLEQLAGHLLGLIVGDAKARQCEVGAICEIYCACKKVSQSRQRGEEERRRERSRAGGRMMGGRRGVCVFAPFRPAMYGRVAIPGSS